jgi:hypothetical protein
MFYHLILALFFVVFFLFPMIFSLSSCLCFDDFLSLRPDGRPFVHVMHSPLLFAHNHCIIVHLIHSPHDLLFLCLLSAVFCVFCISVPLTSSLFYTLRRIVHVIHSPHAILCLYRQTFVVPTIPLFLEYYLTRAPNRCSTYVIHPPHVIVSLSSLTFFFLLLFTLVSFLHVIHTPHENLYLLCLTTFSLNFSLLFSSPLSFSTNCSLSVFLP